MTSQLFSSALNNPHIVQSLKLTSFSEQDLNQRIAAYDSAVGNFENIFRQVGAEKVNSDSQFVFAEGMGNANLRGTSFFDASVTAMVTSIVPYFTIERGMDYVQASLPYMDFYDIVKEGNQERNRVIRPNLGLQTSMDEGVQTLTSSDLTSASQSLTFSQPIIPGQLVITIKTDKGEERLIDDTRGNLLAKGGVITAGKVNYSESAAGGSTANVGSVTFTLSDTFKSGVTIKSIDAFAAFDYTAKDKSDAIFGKVKYYNAKAQQMEVIVKRDIIQEAAINKMGILDPNKQFANAMLDQYHMRRNTKLVNSIKAGYLGNTYELDLSRFSLSTSDYPSYINCFINMLEGIDHAIANRLGSVMNASAYLVGRDGKYAFSTLAASKDWVPNTKATYVVGLVGWWKARPVVYSDRLEANECFASCKTADGNLAPVISGQFLPLSNLPTIGDYNNISKFSTGIYSMESLDLLTSELLQRFTIKLPADMLLDFNPVTIG
jgi:hypothetical protein